MRYPIHILIAEDIKEWRTALREELRKRFKAIRHYRDVEIDTAEDGEQASEYARNRKYDLAALDVGLGKAPDPSGLDVLETIEEQNAAFFVALVTGAATDSSLVKRYGPEAAAVMQVGLQCEAAKRFPPDRIRVVNKPPAGGFEKRWGAVKAALDSVIEAFEYAAAWRYVFRPINQDGKLWEARWNGGPYVRIGDVAGFAEVRYILKSVDREDELTVNEMMDRVRETLSRRRGGGKRKEKAKDPSEHVAVDTGAKETLVFEDVVKMLREGWRSGEITEDALADWHEYLGNNQIKKVAQSFQRREGDEKLAKALNGVLKDATKDGEQFDGKIRLVPRRPGNQNRADDAEDPNRERNLGAFRQQWRRVKARLSEVGLEGMADHFEATIDRGDRNPGRCPYDANLAVRWVLD
jgi:CheY-like chemotaxis protein